jgi:uncharacterized protein YdaU (DUF1376 family)
MSDSPAFQFYPNDFIADPNTMLMTAEEVGAYTLLMAFCWKEESLPDNMADLAKLSRLTKGKFKKAWETRISKCFEKNSDGNFIHPRLERERKKQKQYRENKSRAGKMGANKRWNPTNPDNVPPVDDYQNEGTPNGGANSGAIPVPMANDGFSSSSSSSSSTSVSNNNIGAEEILEHARATFGVTMERVNNCPVPEQFQYPAFMETYAKYLWQMLTGKQWQVTPIQTAEHFRKLIELNATGNDSVQVINQTIAANNKSFYALTEKKLKDEQSDTHKPSAKGGSTKGDKHATFLRN